MADKTLRERYEEAAATEGTCPCPCGLPLRVWAIAALPLSEALEEASRGA